MVFVYVFVLCCMFEVRFIVSSYFDCQVSNVRLVLVCFKLVLINVFFVLSGHLRWRKVVNIVNSLNSLIYNSLSSIIFLTSF